MAALPENVPQKVMDELLEIDVKSRELLCQLESSLHTLEFGNVIANATSSVTGDVDSVERVCEKIISTLKSVAAGTRKYCDLNRPEKREQTARRSLRGDSGIGSGYFDAGDDEARDPNVKQDDRVLNHPIQESMEPQEEKPDPEASPAVEHTDTSDMETSHL